MKDTFIKDYLPYELIDPLFYGFIKETGLPISRTINGYYHEYCTQIAWECYLYCKEHKNEL